MKKMVLKEVAKEDLQTGELYLVIFPRNEDFEISEAIYAVRPGSDLKPFWVFDDAPDQNVGNEVAIFEKPSMDKIQDG